MTGWRVPLSDVLVDEELVAAATDVLRSGWWSMGPRVEELEAAFAESCGTRHAIAVSSGTAALHLAFLALDCGPGDEVILPSLNFVAAANVIVHAGATPVFCDIGGRHPLGLDPESVAALVGPRTKAVLALHYGGLPCDVGALLQLADRHGLAIVEDAAHAPGATWCGRACGTIGAVGCFSFFANKNLPVGEGGMVVTDDDELARRLRLLRSHGMTTLTWDRHRGHAGSYDVLEPGLNYRLDELRAVLALDALRRLPDGNRSRAGIVARYREAFGARLPLADAEDGDVRSAHHLAVLMLDDAEARDRLRDTLARRRIQTSVHYPPIHMFSAYGARVSLPVTEDVASRIVSLPLFPHMTDEDVAVVVEAVLDELDVSSSHGARITAR